jgi:hypothetical protein
MILSRRHLLAGAVALVLLPRSAFAALNDQTEALLALLPDRDAAAKLGARWVQREQKQPGDVLESLQQRLGWSRDADGTTLRHALANAIADDFRNGTVVNLEGWQIARTQAELCALAYFAATGSL